MIEVIISIIAITISTFSLFFSIYTYKKTLPKLRFIFYNSKYHFPIKNKKMDLLKGTFHIEMLAVNSGQKEISIVDIFPPIRQVSEIKVYKGDESKPVYMLNNYSKREVMKEEFGKKQHIPISNCQRLRIELAFKLDSNTFDDMNKETGEIWKDLHNKDFIFITSDRKKYKVNASKILAEYPKELNKLYEKPREICEEYGQNIKK